MYSYYARRLSTIFIKIGFTVSHLCILTFICRCGLVFLFTVVFVLGLLGRTKFEWKKCVQYIPVWKLLVIVGSVGPIYVVAYIASRVLLVLFKLLLPPRYYWYFITPLRHQFRLLLMIILEWVVVAVLVKSWLDAGCYNSAG